MADVNGVDGPTMPLEVSGSTQSKEEKFMALLTVVYSLRLLNPTRLMSLLGKLYPNAMFLILMKDPSKYLTASEYRGASPASGNGKALVGLLGVQ